MQFLINEYAYIAHTIREVVLIKHHCFQESKRNEVGTHQVWDVVDRELRLRLLKDATNTSVDNSEFRHHLGQEDPPK
jgi:hypothetical protein